MKRLLIAVTLLALVLTVLAGIGWKRGEACPPFVGYACFDLTHAEKSEDVVRFIKHAIHRSGATDHVQKRWPGARSVDQAEAAYRASLRYSISGPAERRRLEIWCLAAIDITAVDGAFFPGLLYDGPQFGILSFKSGPVISQCTRATPWERVLFGLGLFPAGAQLP
ncbi:hypothetical protein [Prosthecobacter sp.]|uniref:hypothetical protein n=1 Tax=Prosthecobacter sp. TaxID=1965333 RepID=UPI003783F38E